MSTSRTSLFFILQVVATWLIVIMLIFMTFLVAVASTMHSDCNTTSAVVTATHGGRCTIMEQFSSTVRHYTSYLQSVHTILIQGIATFCLSIFTHSLWAMAWSELESFKGAKTEPEPKITIEHLQVEQFSLPLTFFCTDM